MDRTEEETILYDKLFNIKARLEMAGNTEEKKKELLAELMKVRERLAEIKCEEMLEEERTRKNGKF